MCLAAAALTIPIVKEVCDGRRGAAAPGLGGLNGGEDGGHETLIAVHPEALLAELRVVVRQAQKVTCGFERSYNVQMSGGSHQSHDLVLIVEAGVHTPAHARISSLPIS